MIGLMTIVALVEIIYLRKYITKSFYSWQVTKRNNFEAQKVAQWCFGVLRIAYLRVMNTMLLLIFFPNFLRHTVYTFCVHGRSENTN